jgi:hypothetical protein
VIQAQLSHPDWGAVAARGSTVYRAPGRRDSGLLQAKCMWRPVETDSHNMRLLPKCAPDGAGAVTPRRLENWYRDGLKFTSSCSPWWLVYRVDERT